jgi:predicted aldo/keto reductase-like oxidoreductase
MGKGLKGGKRQKVFLMTKNSGRDSEFAKKCLEDSLRRLQTDHLDLWQFHETNYDNDPDWVMEKGGLKFALRAQKEGKVRYIGFTGHKDPRIHNKMLNKAYDWATAQMPINVMDAHYRSFQKETVPLCLAKDVGVIGMKTLGGGPRVAKIPSGTQITAEQCVRYALSQPVSVIVRGWLTMEQIEADLKIATDFKPLSDREKAEIEAMSKPDAGDGRHELFKSTRVFDGPVYRKMHELPVEGDSF